ncbi:meprin A subunit beta-like [Lineus longissimus]|uniref:meprin A subunit beta-like n=1 Tax=Lineus longissimus TaxID=88925 RepID=UPI002B4D2AEE
MWLLCAFGLFLLTTIECGPVKKKVHIPRVPSPEEQAGLDEGDMDIQPTWSFRSAIKEERYRWPNGIVPYEFSEKALATFTDEQKRNLTLAMGEYHKHTCIRFVPHTDEANYIIISTGKGCSSNVGMMKRYTYPGETPKPFGQRLSLAEGCFNKGTLMHEMMHGLGFYHEQSRWDRDDYVIIKPEYIVQGKLPQFRIYKEERAYKELGAPYDYSSIMHYPPSSFSRYEDEATIVPIKPGAEIGQRRGFSDIDIWKINRLYNCPGSQGVTLPPEVYTTPAKPGVDVKPSMPGHLIDYFYCNFDYLTSCGMRDTFDSDFDWKREDRPTLSKDTGPDTDKSGDGYYLYAETTNRKPGEKAIVIMPYTQPVKRGCLKFWYNMNGETMGRFRIYTRDYLGHEKEVFSLSGDQGNHWTRSIKFISNDTPFEIVFEYEVTDTLGLGDMAIDEVTLSTSLSETMSCERYGELFE